MPPKTSPVPLTVPGDVLQRAQGNPIICAGGHFYIMKNWWREGLPCLTVDNDLQVSVGSVEQKVTNLRNIQENLVGGVYEGVIPAEDQERIRVQVTLWIQAIAHEEEALARFSDSDTDSD